MNFNLLQKNIYIFYNNNNYYYDYNNNITIPFF